MRLLSLSASLILTSLFYTNLTWSAEPSSAVSKEGSARFNLKSFQVGFLGVYPQNGEGSSYSPTLGWNPAISLFGSLDLRILVSGAVLQQAWVDEFFVANYQGFLSYPVTSCLQIEVGGGAQTWVSNGGTAAIFGGNLAYVRKEKLLGFVDRLVLGYSNFRRADPYHQVTLGANFSF